MYMYVYLNFMYDISYDLCVTFHVFVYLYSKVS